MGLRIEGHLCLKDAEAVALETLKLWHIRNFISVIKE